MFYKNGEIEIVECRDYIIYCKQGLYISHRGNNIWYVDSINYCDILNDSEVLYICEINHESLEMIKNVK